jgi:pyruvate formate lyase activating enzyme
MTAEQVLTEICKDTVFFDQSGGGVTFSGGEPLMQPSFLETLLDACRKRRIHTAVDTCGAASRDNLLRLCGKVDLFLFDLKLMDPTRHRKYTGVDNCSILENLKALAGAHNAIIVRLPVISGVNDGEQDIERVLKFLSSMGLFRVDLLPYHELGTDKYRRLGREFRLEGMKPPVAGQMQVIADCFSRNGFTVRMGGW